MLMTATDAAAAFGIGVVTLCRRNIHGELWAKQYQQQKQQQLNI